MAKFRFSLEFLLKHREEIEQRQRDALLRITYTYQHALHYRDSLEEKRRDTMLEMARKQSENPVAGELEWFRLYIKRLVHEIEESEKKLMKLESEVREQKIIVIEAIKKRKVISILKAKREKAFYMELGKKQQREVEEWSSTKYATSRQSIQQEIP